MYRHSNPFRTKNSLPSPRPYNDRPADRPSNRGHVSIIQYHKAKQLSLCSGE